MGHLQAAAPEDVDDVGPPLGALLVVVPGVQLLHGDLRRLAAEGHHVGGAVVPVAVAAVHRVRPQAQRGQPGDGAVQIGVHHCRAPGRLQGKAGMSVPNDPHDAHILSLVL